MKKLISLICVLGFVFASSLQGGEATNEKMRKKLRIVIPKVRLQGVSAEQALDYLRRMSREMDPEGEGLNIIYVRSKKEQPVKKAK